MLKYGEGFLFEKRFVNIKSIPYLYNIKLKRYELYTEKY